MLGIDETKVVLDFGCGPAFYTVPFARVARRVVAVDIKEKMLKKAQSYAEKNRVKGKVQFVKSDGKEMPEVEGNSCDIVFLSFVFHEIDDADKERVLGELRRVLKHGGRLVLMEYVKRPLIGPHSVNPEEVKKELMRSGFPEPEVLEVSKRVGLIMTTHQNAHVSPVNSALYVGLR